MMLLARALTMPCRAIASTLAAANVSGVGDRCTSSAKGVAMGDPNAPVSRLASVDAALTVTCCPSTARTASSNPSKAPGTRKPGLRVTASLRMGSCRRRGGDQVGPGIQIEEIAQPPEECGQAWRQRVGKLHQQGALGGGVRDDDPPRVGAEAHGAMVGRIGAPLRTRQRAGAQECQNTFPVVRRAVDQLHHRAVAGERRAVARRGVGAQATGCHAVVASKNVVEAPHALETAGESHLRDGKGGLGEELFGQQEAARTHQLHRGCPVLLVDDATHLPRCQFKRVGQGLQRCHLAAAHLIEMRQPLPPVAEKRLAGLRAAYSKNGPAAYLKYASVHFPACATLGSTMHFSARSGVLGYKVMSENSETQRCPSG